MAALQSLAFISVLVIYLSYHEAEALNKQCMLDMQTMMTTSTKLIVPCIESLGLSTPAEKKEKALVQNFLNMNITLGQEDAFMLETSFNGPFIFQGIRRAKAKFDRFKVILTYFLQCVMKCVMVKAQMLAPDGSVDMELAQKLLENLPDALKEKASDVIGECGHHAAALEPNEASCESYRDFVTCMLDVSLRMCND